ncbi:hypothetical protein [Sangeribacter muris]|nr:hypothetical protein [Sangeribacter muris]
MNANLRKFPDIQIAKNQILTNLTELFNSELREARRLDFGSRKRGIARI